MKIKNQPSKSSNSNDPQIAFNRAARYLSLRPRSKKEVQDYLFKKGFKPTAIDGAIERLIDLKFLDDRQFGETFMRSRQVYKGKSKFFVKYELRQKGLGEETIQEVAVNAQEDLQTAKDFINRKRHAYSALNKIEFREKIIRQLQSRGFSFDIIKNALKDEK